MSLLYYRSALVVQTRLLPCPVSVWEFWNSPVDVVIGYTQIDPGGRIICRRLA